MSEIFTDPDLRLHTRLTVGGWPQWMAAAAVVALSTVLSMIYRNELGTALAVLSALVPFQLALIGPLMAAIRLDGWIMKQPDLFWLSCRPPHRVVLGTLLGTTVPVAGFGLLILLPWILISPHRLILIYVFATILLSGVALALAITAARGSWWGIAIFSILVTSSISIATALVLFFTLQLTGTPQLIRIAWILPVALASIAFPLACHRLRRSAGSCRAERRWPPAFFSRLIPRRIPAELRRSLFFTLNQAALPGSVVLFPLLSLGITHLPPLEVKAGLQFRSILHLILICFLLLVVTWVVSEFVNRGLLSGQLEFVRLSGQSLHRVVLYWAAGVLLPFSPAILLSLTPGVSMGWWSAKALMTLVLMALWIICIALFEGLRRRRRGLSVPFFGLFIPVWIWRPAKSVFSDGMSTNAHRAAMVLLIAAILVCLWALVRRIERPDGPLFSTGEAGALAFLIGIGFQIMPLVRINPADPEVLPRSAVGIFAILAPLFVSRRPLQQNSSSKLLLLAGAIMLSYATIGIAAGYPTFAWINTGLASALALPAAILLHEALAGHQQTSLLLRLVAFFVILPIGTVQLVILTTALGAGITARALAGRSNAGGRSAPASAPS